jgi:hypothetical protein
VTYEQYVLDVFADHHDCMGLCSEEITDLINETPFSKLERWLTKRGYDLKEMYENDCK